MNENHKPDIADSATIAEVPSTAGMFESLRKTATQLIHDLSDEELSGEEKLDTVAGHIARALEEVDDLTFMYLPSGFREAVKDIVDNDKTDAVQVKVSRFIAEGLYQGYKATIALFG